MNIYLFHDPRNLLLHPMLMAVGTWSDGFECEVCGKHTFDLIEPLQVEWADGSNTVGDFSWASYSTVVLDPVKAWLIEHGFEARFGRVEVRRPTTKTRRPRVAFPYTGPHLNWLIPTAKVTLNETRSGLECVADCPNCKQPRTKFKRDGIVINRDCWNGEKLFRIEQNGKSSAMFVTEEAATHLRASGFSNYLLVPAGQIDE